MDLRVKPEDDRESMSKDQALCEKIRDFSGRTSGLFDAPVHKTMSAAFQS